VWWRRSGPAVGLDLGTAHTVVHVEGRGIVLEEPSVVAVDQATGTVVAAGHEARMLFDRHPEGIRLHRPLARGVVQDAAATRGLVRRLLAKALAPLRRRGRPRVVVGVPAGATRVEAEAIRRVVEEAGAAAVWPVPEPLAVAVGEGLPVEEPVGSLVVDVGGGTAEAAVVALGGLVVARSVPVAGDAVEAAVLQHLRMRHRLLVGDGQATALVRALAAGGPRQWAEAVPVTGRRLDSGIPATVELSAAELDAVVAPLVRTVLDMVRAVLEAAPPEFAHDFLERGLVLTGGGSLPLGLERRLQEETGLPVTLAPAPFRSAGLGVGRLAEDPARLARLARDVGTALPQREP
jgi:rod shape-determining protein MreB